MSRRRFLRHAAAIGALSLAGYSRMVRAEPPPEVASIRLVRAPGICIAPQYLAEDFLRLEGFTEIRYVELKTNNAATALAAGNADVSLDTVSSLLPLLDAGRGLTVLAGIHAGCFALIGNERVEHVRDLAGKRVAVSVLGGPDHTFIASMLAYVGMKPQSDVRWIVSGTVPDSMRLFQAGGADAFLAFAPQPQELRALHAGRVIVDTTEDRPWSQYFCCLAAATRDFHSRNPVATKRALRAILKASDLCARDPELAARFMAEKGYEGRREIGREVIKSLPYSRWRDTNPEDTLRFFALRLRDAGMIKSTPQQIIDRGSNFSFLNELKKEMKA